MIGTLPMSDLAPLDYRYAMDAAMSVLARTPEPIILCNVSELIGEVRQRIPIQAKTSLAALWIEPLTNTWRNDLQSLTSALPKDAPLIIISSQHLARLLPERHHWLGQPLGYQLGGISRLRGALAQSGFKIEVSYGIHSALAMGLNLSSRLLEDWHRPDTADRLHFSARLHYCVQGPSAALATVILLITRKYAG